MLSVKLSYEKELRRVQVNVDEKSRILKFETLSSAAKTLFPALRTKSSCKVSFLWIDEENDTVRCSTDDELVEAIRIMKALNRNAYKFEISIENKVDEIFKDQQNNEENQRSKFVTHENIKCDSCGVSPIIGIRFKCGIREDFDLCEKCEEKEVQPYPMIKISNPDQAPAAVFLSNNWNNSSPFLPQQPHHNPHHRGPPPPHHAPHHHGAGGRHRVFGPFRGGKFERKWERNAEKLIQKCGQWGRGVRDVVAEVNKEYYTMARQKSADEDLEEQLLKEAIQQSMETKPIVMVDNMTSSWREQAPEKYQPMTAAAAAAPPGIFSLPTQTPIVGIKPMARFIRDVTFPDGTKIQPGVKILKTWRVRNDGVNAWPHGVVLACSGGDHLTDPDLISPVPIVAAGEEIDISVQLTAPSVTGRHVAYFRLKTSDEMNFGQRLWADIRVTDEENDWHVVRGLLVDDAAAPAGDCHAVSEKSNPTKAADVSPTVETEAPTAGTDTVVHDHSLSSSWSSEELWERVWSKELDLLAAMGFTDRHSCLPLLQKMTVPASICPDMNNTPSAQGMQKVVAALLRAGEV